MEKYRKLVIPYQKATRKSEVLKADDTVIFLFKNHLEIHINATELRPISEDDDMLGVKEHFLKGEVAIKKEWISTMDYGWSNDCECWQFSIGMGSCEYAYNTSTKDESITNYLALKDWWLD